MINHRFEIVRKIGAGGTAEVFLVDDLLCRGAQIAMKMFYPTHQHGGESEQAFHNEVSALATLSHPNLVKMHDIGKVHSATDRELLERRFFTMEFIHGAEALDKIALITESSDKLALIQNLLLQALSVLSYVHREGLIHCDIKPQNLVLVGESDDQPLLKLMDFGFATAAGMNVPGSARGTLEYTSPEILLGKRIDHRSDLYSLGITFYHLLEGHCPFEAQDPIELTKRILTDNVVFTKASDTLGRLQQVLARLIAKEPDARYATAEEAAAALIEHMQRGSELYETYFGTSTKSKFVGRQRELQLVENLLATLGRNDPASKVCVSVGGIDGIGKSRFIAEAKKVAVARDVPVYTIEAVAAEIPFGGIAPFIETLACDVRSVTEAGSQAYHRYDSVLRFHSDATNRAGHWSLHAENTIEALARFVVECANEFCFVLSVVGTSRLDAESLRVLSTILRDAQPGRMLLLVEGRTTQWATDKRDVEELYLRDLSEEEVQELCTSSVGGSSFGRELSMRLFNLYGGTPGTLVETLNAVHTLLREEPTAGSDRQTQSLDSLVAKLPRNLDEVFETRFRQFNRERQLILTMLSCFHFPVKQEVIALLLPFGRQRLIDHIRALHHDDLIGFSGPDSLLFIRIEKLKEIIVKLIQSERMEINASIAATLEDKLGSPDVNYLQELAYQFEAIGEFRKAEQYCEAAADEAKRLHAIQRSVQLYEAALRNAAKTPNSRRFQQLRLKLSMALFEQGSYRKAIELANELNADDHLQREFKFAALRVIGLSLARVGENVEAEQKIRAAIELGAAHDALLELRQELVGLQIVAGNFAAAEHESMNQLADAEKTEKGQRVAIIYTNLGIATFFQNRFDDAVHWFRNAMSSYEALNDKLQITNAMNNIANALSAKGDNDKAIEFWQKALTSSRESGTMNQQAQILNNLGIAHLKLNLHNAAKEHYKDAGSLYERIGSKSGIAATRGNLGEVLLAECEYESALTLFRDAKTMQESLDNSNAVVEQLLNIARVLYILGDLAQMKQRLDDAYDMIEKHNQQMYLAAYNELSGRLELKLGEAADASLLLAKAVELFKSDGAREPLWLAQLRLVESLHAQGDIEEALALIDEVANNREAMKSPMIVAELNYLLGTIALTKEGKLDNPILYLKRGLEAIQREPVSETTWKLTYAIAKEYYTRGQHQKSKAFLQQTNAVVQFVASHFSSPLLKEQYLRADNKESVLATIESITHQ